MCKGDQYPYQEEAVYDTCQGRICRVRLKQLCIIDHCPSRLLLLFGFCLRNPGRKLLCNPTLEILIVTDALHPPSVHPLPDVDAALAGVVAERARASKTHANAGLERLRDFNRINLVRLILAVERVIQFLCRRSAGELLG